MLLYCSFGEIERRDQLKHREHDRRAEFLVRDLIVRITFVYYNNDEINIY